MVRCSIAAGHIALRSSQTSLHAGPEAMRKTCLALPMVVAIVFILRPLSKAWFPWDITETTNGVLAWMW
jgi:hypothetical protein